MAVEPTFYDFSIPESLDDIAKYIGTTRDLIEQVISEPDQSTLYEEHSIPKKKKSKDFRIVWEIDSDDLREAHKSFQRRFERFASLKSGYPTVYSHGYTKGKSTFTNASEHVKKQRILHADIKDFFPTIKTIRLQKLFQTFDIKPYTSEVLAKFLTINGSLALGLPSSPLLANLTCLELDKNLADLASKYNAKYTRYADDITISSDDDLPTKIEIKSILDGEGFILAEEKFHYTKLGQSHFVTGLSVSDDKPRLPKKMKRQIRQELRFAKKFGLNDHFGRINENSIQQGINRLDGTIRYINSVEPNLAKKFKEAWNEILSKTDTKPGYLSDKEKSPWTLTIFFDAIEVETNSGKVLIAGCVTTEDEERINAETKQIIEQYSVDPVLSGYDIDLGNKGISFQDVHENVRTEYIEKLRYLTFRSFIAYDFFDKYDSYEDIYLSLLSTIIPKRFMYADQAEVTIVFREDLNLIHDNTVKLIDELYSSLEQKKHMRPLNRPNIIQGKKNNYYGLSVIDFVLHVFSRYAELHRTDLFSAEYPMKNAVNEETKNRYERLRDKIRFIYSKITNEVFTQKEEFTPWTEGSPNNKNSSQTRYDKTVKFAESNTPELVRNIIQDSPRTLIMKGGSVKGLAYIGAIRELERYYNFDWFAGTSAGAIAASLLAIGFTTDELEKELRSKKFLDFLDAGFFKAISNLRHKSGLFEADAFTHWLDQLFRKKIESVKALPLKCFPKRLTIYASKRDEKALIFDSKNSGNISASFAVRCSMSIPIVFTPQLDQGFRVFDGGMQNNYPVDVLLDETPNMKFIGLYLGNYYEGMKKKPGLFQDMLNILTEANDIDALDRHHKNTIVIDPRPITSYDFWLTNEEKDYLVKSGEFAALSFLLTRKLKDGPTQQDVERARNALSDSLKKIEPIRKKRKSILIFCGILLIIILLIIGGAIVILSGKILSYLFFQLLKLIDLLLSFL